jgi:hypothetical protein
VTQLEGGTEREVIEAVAVGSLVSHWSAVLNGALYDEVKFRREVDAAIAHVKASLKQHQAKNDQAPPRVQGRRMRLQFRGPCSSLRSGKSSLRCLRSRASTS